jgi:dihydroneopterin aldolase
MIIKIKNLKIATTIGVYKWEETHQRTLIFNVEIETDLIDGMKSDDLKDSIDYDIVVNQIKHFVENHHCQLIEKMVGELLDLIMQDKRIKRCTLEVDKTKVYDFVDSFSVTQTRLR